MSRVLEKVLSNYFREFTPIVSSFYPSKYIFIDLSLNSELLKTVDISDPLKMDFFIKNYLSKKDKEVAFGGYIEKRNLYDRSDYFNGDSKRNVHLGIDLWCPQGTDVLAPLKGKIHSFANNLNYGDYGPTIILEHELDDIIFYTLYGHLSIDSLSNLKVGTQVNQGEIIAQLGTYQENGSYAPHLHFQIINDIGFYRGDYPGVSDENNLEFYKNNCPDPDLILCIN